MGSTPTSGIQSPIPPGPDGGCPIGYQLNPVDNMCYFVAPPVGVTSTGVTLPDVDPRNAGQLTGLGLGDSGLPERFALAHWHVLRKAGMKTAAKLAQGEHWIGELLGDLLSPFVWMYLSGYDIIVSVIAGWLTESKTRDNPFFWLTIGELISDLLQTPVDGAKLYQDMQAKGTVAAMQDVGSALLGLLIGEFTGTLTGSQGMTNAPGAPNATTGLPEATLSPLKGVQGAQALMGFVLSSSVRQANIEGLTDAIPYGFGKIFDKYSEAMRTNLGIGRMLRFALRPVFQIVADQLKWAINLQYRPKGFNAAEAARETLAGRFEQTDFLAETAMMDGYTDKRALGLLDQHTRRPALNELNTLRAAMKIQDQDFDNFLRRDGFDTITSALVRQAADLEPARRVSLALAEHYMLEFGRGNLTTQSLRDFLDALRPLGFLLTPGEIQGLEAVGQQLSVNVKLRPRHLSPGQLKQAYIDGTITLEEYEAHLSGLGYNADDVQTLGIEVLLAAKNHAAAAAKHAAAAKKGKGPAPAPAPTTPPATGTGG